MASDPAEARAGVLATLAAYESAEIGCRPADLAGVFSARGVLEVGGRVHRGRAVIQAVLEGLVRRPRVAGSPAWPTDVVRRTYATEIDLLDVDEVRSRSWFEARSVSGPDHRGHYDDRLAYDAASGAWLIVHRSIHIDSTSSASSLRSGVPRSRATRWLAAAGRPALAGPSGRLVEARSRTSSRPLS